MLDIIQSITFHLLVCCLKTNVEYTKLYFACGSRWLRNLVSYIKEGTSEHGAEKNIWNQRKEVAGGWIILRIEEINNLCP
jgi:hypothetical protein